MSDERQTHLTLTIDREVLRAAQDLARGQGTSVDRLIRQHLEALVGKRSRQETARRRLLRAMNESRVEVGERTWTRDDLYER